MNKQPKCDLIHLYDENGHEEYLRLQEQLMSLSRPTLNDEARSRILLSLHNTMTESPVEHIITLPRTLRFRYPAQSALRLAASFAIFIVLLYQFGIPAIQEDKSIETVYPIQRSAEMQDVDLISVYFS